MDLIPDSQTLQEVCGANGELLWAIASAFLVSLILEIRRRMRGE